MTVQRPKRVLCVMDLSLVGRSSMAVVLPVLAACGVQACALPAALFSTHTGGFGKPRKKDEATFCAGALQHFMQQDVRFDAVYAGYLCSEAQFALAADAMCCWPYALHVVDPAMGDEGKAYAGLGEETAQHMRMLCAGADIITPNFTESALLLGEAPAPERPPEDVFEERMKRLSAGRSVVVTGVPAAGGMLAVRGCGPDGAQPFELESERVPGSWPGTGDLYTAALCGLMLGGKPMQRAAATAARFVAAAVKATHEAGNEARHGVWFEPHLEMLWREARA